ncbi:UNVERIFIED_CONTAM: General transcription and DNA repair factor IIH subunit TFB1-1 [Sesamum calycinum]|uniref:General transcription and DNA repair factor IIH subunit TFB1-1 n=1 Tax=Sesamum calycinum TaxID=2727403 RepID=A0AAW2MDM4_9LAMI
MADKQVIKRAKYKSSVKDPGVAGVLKMGMERFVFMPNDPKSTTKLNVEFRMIKGHKFTKEGSSKQALLNLTQDQGGNYIFEFDSFADRDACREFVANAIAFHAEAGRVVPDKSAPPVNNEQLSREETERRIKLLQENRYKIALPASPQAVVWTMRMLERATLSVPACARSLP